MNRLRQLRRLVVCALVGPAIASAQENWGTLVQDLRQLTETPAVAGYEQDVSSKIGARLKAFSPKTDAMGNVTVTLGTGSPHRLIVAPIDEPGFVVSNITPAGYLQVQRLPQNAALPLFNELYSAQPVKIQTARGAWISGAVAGISIHLLPQRQHPPSAADLDNMYIDIGAANASEARLAGADRLLPLAIDRTFYELGSGMWSAPSIGDRFGDAVLLELLRRVDRAKIPGTLTVAFVVQQWLGSRGLERLLYELKPDELIYLGRLMRAPLPAANAPAAPGPALLFTQAPGGGVLIGLEKPDGELSGMAAELKQLAERNHIPLKTDYSAPLEPRGGYAAPPPLPQRTVHLSVASGWPSTPAETVDSRDVGALLALLETYLEVQAPRLEPAMPEALAEPGLPARPQVAPAPEVILKQLIETYGVSGGHEGNVTKIIERLLPAWAKTRTDQAGNLWLDWPGSGKGPRIAVVAHQDEIGYEVRSIFPDGRLELITRGGGVLAYFLGHAALVHSANGMHPGVLELPDGWEKPDFQWPRGQRLTFRMDVGARNPDQVAALGIKAGDFVTVPKKYRKLAGQRASARAFDDRIGCAALVAAAWALGPNLKGRDLTFIWSTSEELGLEGAAAAANKLAADGKTPDYVFAVDTFVSSDSPLESERFGDALLGQGFVVRAVDNSNVVPRKLVEKVVSIAHAAGAAVQYGVTGGGNDGAAFLVYGSTDVALGWPLRYSHSPGEVIDVRDLEALAKAIAAIGRNW
jgi:putative aminopeptidase